MSMLKFRFVLLGLGLCLVGLTISCNSNKPTSDQDVFRYNTHENINTLDPAFARDLRSIWAMNQIFNGLVRLDDQLNIQPDIASSWEILDQGRTYRFTLRNDVYFHESDALFGDLKTRRVIAQDFVYSFERLQDPKLASPGLWTLEHVSNYEAVNDSVFVIKLKKPFSPFLGVLSMKYLSVLPKELKHAHQYPVGIKPIGTGPFYLKAWMPNLKMVLRKNSNYFESDQNGNPLPYLEAVSISFVPDKQSEFLLFLQGKLDLLNSLDVSYKDELLNKKGQLQDRYKNKYQLLRSPFLNTEYIGIYMDAEIPEVKSRALRQALNYAIDREEMIQFLKNNIGYPADQGFVPKGLNAKMNVTGYRYDPEKAMELIKEFKKNHNNKTPELTLSTDANYVDLCTYLQHAYEKVGVKLHIEVMPPAALRQAKTNGKTALFRASWVADYPDPENYLLPFHSANFTPNGPNYTHFSDAEFDREYTNIVQTTDAKLRNHKMTYLDQMLIEEAPFIILYYDEALRFVQPKVQGMTINPINMLDLRKVYKD
ncbi:MAG: ABC transporter substrate-binding protein [Flavobacteriaceae bacterium]|nr:ABC transporter substrate-binding protein [Flavobacteriaceae bacterium]